MSVDVSPDGQTIIFDLLGDLYSLPVSGGHATPITTGSAWDQTPRFSSDGRFIYFVSDRRGFKNIWRLALADQSLTQVTQSESDVQGGLNWSRHSPHLIVGRADTDPDIHDSEVVLHSVEPQSGTMTPLHPIKGPWFDTSKFEPLRQRFLTYSGVQTDDGSAYFSDERWEGVSGGRRTVRMYKLDAGTQTITNITPVDVSYSEYKPQLSHDGTQLAYFRQYPDRRTEIRVRNLASGKDDVLAVLSNADDASYSADDESRPNCAFTPDDRQFIFWHDGKIHSVDLADGSREIIPFTASVELEVAARVEAAPNHLGEDGEASVIRWPTRSRDGRMTAFAAIGYVWIMDTATGRVRRLTNSTDVEYMPALSPDGTAVAYISFAHSDDGFGPGRLLVAEVNNGAIRELLGGVDELYLLPKWSSDGSMIAVIREEEGGNGVLASFGWTSATNGEFRHVASAPSSDEYTSQRLYARHVSFDKWGRNVLFSYPRSRHESVLAAAGLSSGDVRVLAIGDFDVAGITPAPDLKNLALTRIDDSVWVVPFEAGIDPHTVSISTSNAQRVSEDGGYYVDWNHSGEFSFGFGQRIYGQNLRTRALDVRRIRLTFEKPKAAHPIAFVGARLITMSGTSGVGRVIESGALVVNGERIVAVGSIDAVGLPRDSVVVDTTGKTIIPGLLDTHYHRIARDRGKRTISGFKLPNRNFSDHSAIEYGVTTAWEPGGPFNDGVPAVADLQVAGRVLGPRWSHSAAGTVGYPWRLLTSYGAALAAVKQHRDLGVTTLKEYDTPTREQRRWLSAAARASNLGIVSHLETFDGMMTRIVDGYTGGDHPHIPIPFFKDVQELLRQTGYIWTPNFGITGGLTSSGSDPMLHFCHAVAKHGNNRPRATSDRSKSSWPCHKELEARRPMYSFDTHRVGRVAVQAAEAANNGVKIGISAHTMPGSYVHREMWYLWKGGMAVEDVLRATTVGNAEKLGLQEEIGSLAVGKVADFIVLEQNPLDDILNTLSLRYTVQGGVVYDSATAKRIDVSSLAREAERQTIH